MFLAEAGTKLKVNNLSPELREKLEEKLKRMSRYAKYHFHISHRNPDPEKHGGDRILPACFTLQPVTFYIQDKGRKKIGLPKDALDQHGDPAGFSSIMVLKQHKATITLDLDTAEGRDRWAYIELHPANPSGLFPNNQEGKVVEFIDEVADAKKRGVNRKIKADVLYVANNFTRQEDKDFAAAMGWDEDMDHDILRDQIETLAENNPEFFKEFVESKSFATRAIIARAEAFNIIQRNTEEYKYQWNATKETIVAFGRKENLDWQAAMADWLLSDKNGNAVFEKIKSLIKASKKSMLQSQD